MRIAQALKNLVVHSQSETGGAIGVDFSIDAIHALQLVEVDGKTGVRAKSRVPYPTCREDALGDLALLTKLLKQLIGAAKFKGRHVVLAMPSSQLRVIPIQYSAPKDGNESRAILELVKDRLPEPLEQYVIDYIPVRHDQRDGQNLALVAVARKSNVTALLHSVNKARLKPRAIEIGPVAIRRLVASFATADDAHNTLVINIGEQKSYLTVISGRRLLMDQEVSIGKEQLLDAVATELDLTRTEALSTIQRCGLNGDASSDPELLDQIQTLGLILTPGFRTVCNEIDKAFRYASSVTRGSSGQRVILSGSVTRWPGAATFLGNLAETDVEFFPPPFTPDETDTSLSPYAGELAVATGLALRGLSDDG